jgi:hypothetical protein
MVTSVRPLRQTIVNLSQDFCPQVLKDAQPIIPVPIFEIQQAIITKLVLGKGRIVPIIFPFPGSQNVRKMAVLLVALQPFQFLICRKTDENIV